MFGNKPNNNGLELTDSNNSFQLITCIRLKVRLQECTTSNEHFGERIFRFKWNHKNNYR